MVKSSTRIVHLIILPPIAALWPEISISGRIHYTFPDLHHTTDRTHRRLNQPIINAARMKNMQAAQTPHLVLSLKALQTHHALGLLRISL